MFERFTDQARRVLVLAQEEARLLDHWFIGSEHLLLGILGLQRGAAVESLGSVGIHLEAARTKVAAIIIQHEIPDMSAPPFTPRVKKVLELSLRQTLSQGQAFISEADILLGLLQDGESRAVQVMTSFGPDVTQIRNALVEHLTRSSVV